MPFSNVQAMSDLASLPVGERVRVLGGKNFEKSGAPVWETAERSEFHIISS